MIKVLLSSAVVCLLFASCLETKGAGETADQKLKRYEAHIQGLWKWKDIPTQTLLLANGSSVYIINGKRDRDSGTYALTLDNPNPKAPYLKMAEIFSAGKMVFLKNDKNLTADHTVANRKKVYAILGMKDDFIQMIDTENGTIWEYIK